MDIRDGMFAFHELFEVPAEAWAWAARDEENHTGLDSRAKTTPHFITMDGEGRVLIGNPHFVVRIKRDKTLDRSFGKERGPGFENDKTGYVRFTASPYVEDVANIPPPSCVDPDERIPIDTADDPLPGSFQILMAGVEAFQVRGANATLDRDVTIDPIDRELWTYKHPVYNTEQHELFVNTLAKVNAPPKQWPRRIHAWTITNNGNDKEPHVEVLFRPTMHQPAWPGEGGTTDAERFSAPTIPK
jgi:hypothetical protein